MLLSCFSFFPCIYVFNGFHCFLSTFTSMEKQLQLLLWLLILVDQVEADLESQRLFVTTDKTPEELLTALKKTGKAVEYVGPAS